MADIHANWKRDFDVYDRLREVGIELGEKSATISDPKGRRICSFTDLHPVRAGVFIGDRWRQRSHDE